MFDIGFWEILLIAVIALVVVGPERFPGMIRTVGYWFGRVREMASSVKYELEKEVDKADKLQELINKQVLLEEKHRKLQEEQQSAEADRKPVPVSNSASVGKHVDEQEPPPSQVAETSTASDAAKDNKIQDKTS